MKKYQITVNGKSYEVEVEEIGGAASSTPQAVHASNVKQAPVSPAPSAPKATPASVTPTAPAAPAKEVPAGGVKVNSPMPGTILDVRVSVGQSVKKGDVLTILEAMKMENEIMAPQDGVVSSIQVVKGASVNTGEVLIVLE